MPPTGDPDFGCPDTANINCKLTASLQSDLTADLDEKEALAKSACTLINHIVTPGTEISPTVNAPTSPAVVTVWEKYLLGRERLCDADWVPCRQKQRFFCPCTFGPI